MKLWLKKFKRYTMVSVSVKQNTNTYDSPTTCDDFFPQDIDLIKSFVKDVT